MKKNSRPSLRERGVTMIMFSLMLFVFLGFAALSVDLGYLFMVRGDLQRAADAAALAGTQKLPDLASAISTAQQIASLNLPNQGTVLSASDIIIGTWDAQTQTLTSGGTNLAMSVKIRRTSATQNPVTLFFASLLGVSSRDVTAIAIAEKINPLLVNNVVGMGSITMSGATWIDSYDATAGAYSTSTATSLSNVASNGNIKLSGSATIKGDAYAGKNSSVILSGGASVTGNKSNLTSTISYAAAPAPTSYNNNGLSSNLTVGGSTVLNMTPGTYYLSSLTISNGGSIKISGPTTIYVNGSVNVSGAGFINQGQLPSDLNIFITKASGATVKLAASAAFYGMVYAPTASLTVSGAAGLYGAFIGNSVTIQGSGAIHVDKSLKEPFAVTAVQLRK